MKTSKVEPPTSMRSALRDACATSISPPTPNRPRNIFRRFIGPENSVLNSDRRPTIESSLHLTAAEPPRQESVDRCLARAENQHDQRSDQKCKGRGGRKFVGIGKDREQRLAIGRDVSDDHIDHQRKRDQA